MRLLIFEIFPIIFPFLLCRLVVVFCVVIHQNLVAIAVLCVIIFGLVDVVLDLVDVCRGKLSSNQCHFRQGAEVEKVLGLVKFLHHFSIRICKSCVRISFPRKNNATSAKFIGKRARLLHGKLL